MDNPEVVTVEAVRNFILHKGGKVTNHELVRHFKGYLTNPDNRVEARNHFKEIVNFVATIIRNDDGEKYLVLKKRFRNQGMVGCNSMDGLMSSPPMSPEPLNSVDSANSLGYLYPNQLPGGYHYSNSQDSIGRYSGSQDGVNRYQSQDSVNSYHSQDGANRYPSPDGVGRYFSQDNMNRYASQEGVNRYLNNQDLNRFSQQDSINHFMSPPRHVEPPPYRPPPPPVRPHLPSQSSFDDNMSLSSSVSSGSINRQSSLDDPFLSSGDGPPPVPPRRRSSCDKIQPMKADNKENANSNKEFSKRPKTIGAESDLYSAGAIDVENRKISVKECTQKFNRLASESSPKHFNLPTASTISSALKKRHEKAADHEDDTASVTSVGSDAKSREWMIQSARSEYQTLAKLAAENPRLVRFKDPCNVSINFNGSFVFLRKVP
ncbi:uncharacterized protein sowah isoform X1 [Bemisia tabaci]|uniref:uncharacterized protein sowah isoform X1 n=1 Tax=Bemisia tabaci TaxID=7038 RepID=UPI003B27BE1C